MSQAIITRISLGLSPGQDELRLLDVLFLHTMYKCISKFTPHHADVNFVCVTILVRPENIVTDFNIFLNVSFYFEDKANATAGFFFICMLH